MSMFKIAMLLWGVTALPPLFVTGCKEEEKHGGSITVNNQTLYTLYYCSTFSNPRVYLSGTPVEAPPPLELKPNESKVIEEHTDKDFGVYIYFSNIDFFHAFSYPYYYNYYRIDSRIIITHNGRSYENGDLVKVSGGETVTFTITKAPPQP